MWNVVENPVFIALSAMKVYAIPTSSFAQYVIVDLYALTILVPMHAIAIMMHFEIFKSRTL